MSTGQQVGFSQAKIGNKTVVSSGSYLLPSSEDGLEITFTPGKKIKFNFIEDKKNTNPNYVGSASDNGNDYELKLINFTNMLGEGLSDGFAFFKSEEATYYIAFWVVTNNNGSRVVNLTMTKD